MPTKNSLPPDPERRRRAINNKARGKNLERKVVQLAQAHQLDAKRAWGSNGRALGLPDDVDVVVSPKTLKPLHFQCKKTKKLRKDFQLEKHLHGVIIEGDRTEPVVLVRLSHFLSMTKVSDLAVQEWSRQEHIKAPSDLTSTG